MEKIIRYYFYFSKSERIGLLALLSFLFVFALAPRLYAFFKTEVPADFTEFDQAVSLLSSSPQIANNNINTEATKENSLFAFDPNTLSKDSLMLLGLSKKLANTIDNYRNKGGRFYQKEDLKKIYGLSKDQYNQLRSYVDIQKFGKPKPLQVHAKKKRKTIPVVLSPFDPNTATEEDFYRLGLSQKVSRIILKYRSKGGRFYEKEDLKKIYSLSEEQYQKLKPYINIDTTKTKKKKQYTNAPDSSKQEIKKRTNRKKSVHIDINQATEEEWQTLRGIGPAYSKWIIKYRNKLGGFISVNQVAETYGIPDSTFQKILPFLQHPKLPPKLIPINTCDASILAAHPYINYKQANAIIAYRKQHGSFGTVEDLRKIIVIDEALFKKINPYLTVE